MSEVNNPTTIPAAIKNEKKGKGRKKEAKKKNNSSVMVIESEEAPQKQPEPRPLSSMEIEMEFLALANKLPKRGRKKKTIEKKVSITKSLMFGKETPKPIAFRTRTKTNAMK